MIYKITPILVFFLISFTSNGKKNLEHKLSSTTVKVEKNTKLSSFAIKAALVYNSLNSNNLPLPRMESFAEALKGFYSLKEKGLIQKDILTIVDFSLSSNVKRLWVIDLTANKILFNSLVAHGRNTGDEFAKSFSNKNSSFKSSLGFYLTGEIYVGKHGKSLKLDGLEKGINDNARQRGVVIHAANYVSNSFIKNHRRLGRSQGCPALPEAFTKEIINTIKNKSCLFIYHPSRDYSTINNITA